MHFLRAVALSILLAASSLGEDDRKVVDLTDETIDNFLSTGNHFVKFFAPWCGHCKRLAPTWDELPQSLDTEANVKISKVDCTLYKSVCENFQIKGFPTLLWIVDGETVEKYSGSRSLDSLKEYVHNKVKAVPDEKPEAESSKSVLEITQETFEGVVKSGLTFVKFFAPWCGHCKNIAPTWVALGDAFSGTNGVTIAEVDCTKETNKYLCKEQEVTSFPTLQLYQYGEKLSVYKGNRELDHLTAFVNKHLQRHDEV